MRVTLYYTDELDLESAKEQGASDILLSPKSLSRFGQLKFDQLSEIANKIRGVGLRPVLEWDILMVETSFQATLSLFEKNISLDDYDAIRVQDPGALEYVLTNTKLPVQLVLEQGNP